jgi:xylulokinase
MGREDGKYILAVDLGTSGAKVALVSTSGNILDHEFEPTSLFLLPGGGAEQDPDDWWGAICRATQSLLTRSAVRPEEVLAINCTTQWAGTVPVSREGRHLMNAIIWMDARGAPYVQSVVGGAVKIEGYDPAKLIAWIRVNGAVPGLAGKDPVGHILYVRHERPDVYRETYKFLEPKDYVNLRLTGQFAASYDSIAQHPVTDNRDVSHVSYDEALLRLTTIPRDKLPDLKPTATVLGCLTSGAARDLGLKERVRVVIGTPDIQSAAIGSGAVRDYHAHIYLGTSSWLVCHVPFKKTDLIHFIASFPSAIPGRYLAINEQETAGACLTFLRDTVLYADDELAVGARPANVYSLLDRIAEKAPAGSDGVIFTPWLYGERTPVDDESVRGGFHNLSLQSNRADLVRAVFEGVAYNTRWLFGYMERFVGRRLDGIHLIGGGARSGLWCQVYADVLNRTIRQVKEPSLANLRGVAFQAAVALGYMTFDEIPGRVPILDVYRPNPANRRVYDELFREFVNTYHNNRKIYARLNRRTGLFRSRPNSGGSNGHQAAHPGGVGTVGPTAGRPR